MAFDKPTRNRLSSFVAEARDLIAGEFAQQFQSLYGISDKGTIAPLEQLCHLDDIGLATAALLRERIDYLVKTHPDDREGIKAAVTRLAREQAFTVLNRLAAIRMAEKRGLIVESVGKGYQSKGFKVFEQVAGSGLGDIYHRYRRYLFCLFDELAIDLGLLFERHSPQSLLFPREPALLDLLDLLNAADLDVLWAEDETIGWIYQYYNDPAERKKMREESAAPRNSRELAVRNQFFTPRYVVEFLTDNTLGRIWYEMTQGQTRLKDQCRYLVRRPTEIFLNPGETAPENPPQEGLSKEELLKQVVHIPHRPIKDPRELRLLDPACGSMHFGLYAFDLFEVIYEEAWDLGLESIRCDYPEREALLHEVPRLILEHNLHGIDIDPRCVQIAGLSLWLRAQKSWQARRVPAAQRPRILRSNIVCAEPMPGSPELLKEFTATLHPPLLGQLVEKVFAHMQLAGEAGSLLKIEEEIATLVKEAKKLWHSRPREEQLKMGFVQETEPKQSKLPLDLSGISDKRFWETAEERIYAALRAYAEQAETGSYQRRLFAEDASRGFAFIDLCRKRYDVVLMNPPFGEFSLPFREIAAQQFLGGSNDIITAFVERGAQLKIPNGLEGVISSRTVFFAPTSSKWRQNLIVPSGMVIWVELGEGVLDTAMVEVCMYVVGGQKGVGTIFTRPKKSNGGFCFTDIVYSYENSKSVFLVELEAFQALRGWPFAYWLDRHVFYCLENFTSLEKKGVKVRVGLQTGDDFRFIRLWPEVPSEGLLSVDDWLSHAKGGDNSPYYTDIHLVVNWKQQGKEVAAQPSVRLNMYSGTNPDLYLAPGMTFSYRTNRFSPGALPAKSITGVAGMGVFSPVKDLPLMLAFLNSSAVNEFISARLGLLEINALYQAGTVQPTPVPEFNSEQCEKLTNNGLQLCFLIRNILRNSETSRLFLFPFHSAIAPKLTKTSAKVIQAEAVDDALNIFEDVDSIVFTAYDFGPAAIEKIGSFGRDEMRISLNAIFKDALPTESDAISYFIGIAFGRWDIQYATDEKAAPELPDPFAPLPVCPPGMLQDADSLPAAPKDVPANYPLRISWPGILVDDENHPEDIVARVREVLEVIWKGRADAIEQEVCELLGVKTLRDYFRRPAGFFADHLKRYSKSRREAPIYWPLSTGKGSYILWIYYQRLTNQTLHTSLADFVDPKIKAVRAEISSLRESTTHRDRLEELQDLESELEGLRAEIERIIKLPWKPNLNDGVLITASPLWKLFRLSKWQRDLKGCWDKLERGDYDWSHLAYSIWPKRVENLCKQDRSVAIAHNLEHLCQIESSKPKAKRGKKKTTAASEELE